MEKTSLTQHKLVIDNITIIPIWSESMGAKSFSIFIDTGDVKILIDAGASIMQPSFPLSKEEKINYVRKALDTIVQYSKNADVVTITHYHYDHFRPNLLELYIGKTILAKDPNKYINESQRKRAERFYSNLYSHLTGEKPKFLNNASKEEFANPLEKLEHSMRIDFGDYSTRRRQLIEEGLKRFQRLSDKWNSWQIIPEFKINNTRCFFADNREFTFGKTIIRFGEPMFHGIEFSKVGWVVPIVIKRKDAKILYTSDLSGPIIEDYADWIIEENPDVLFIDGPPTYLIPYMFNLINFRRCLENLKRIIQEIDSHVIFLDHHLTRDIRFRTKLKEVYEFAREKKKEVLTFAEFYGQQPLAEILLQEKEK